MPPSADPLQEILAESVRAAREAVVARRLRDADRMARRALVISPALPAALRPAAVSAFRERRFVPTIRHVRRLITVVPTELRFFHMLAEAHLNLRNASNARKAAQRALLLSPADPFVHQLLGRAVALASERIATVRVFEHMRILSDNDNEVLKALMRSTFAANDFEASLRWAEASIAKAGATAELDFWHGRALRMLGREPEAAAAFDRAVAQDSSYDLKRRLVELTLIAKDFRLPENP